VTTLAVNGQIENCCISSVSLTIAECRHYPKFGWFDRYF
jgi:hypothetical protein